MSDRDTSSPGTWCNFCQCFHSSASCFHPWNQPCQKCITKGKRIEELEARFAWAITLTDDGNCGPDGSWSDRLNARIDEALKEEPSDE